MVSRPRAKDSAMTNIRTILVKIPLNSKDISLSKAHCSSLVKKFKNVEEYEVDLSDTFDLFKQTCLKTKHSDELGFANSKSRLRMMLLYQIAQSSSGIVVGTGNKETIPHSKNTRPSVETRRFPLCHVIRLKHGLLSHRTRPRI